MTSFIDYVLGGFGSGMIIALMALALVLTWRATRVVNFAQVGQAMFTTFIALSLQTLTGSWVIALVGAMVAGALLGVIVQYLVLRPVKRADTSGAIIATFGVLIALQAAAGMIWGGDSRAYPQPFGNTAITLFGREWPVSAYDLVVVGFAVILVVGLTLLFTRTNLGLAMRATAFNPEVARLSGIRVGRTLTIGWALAGIVGAVAGVLVAPTSAISPNSFDILLVFAFTAAVIGGLDSLIGAVALGIGTGLILSVVSGYSDSSNAPVVALVLLAVNLVLKPEGVFGHHKARSV
ncbi:MAG: branched-chain amino acid ABC transporter permease [Candidatus Nanopelagicales bacterium]|jgi:branched-chain amino acid transport system permease protein|nr:branched-chain amino acid ABC transporter permease [Candidatus Nanopelagicales bacterium]MCF8537340.1 branched-chain amino acid ABC transporter permease [Candidatus Nanopelagicales bacterium]MCF8542203.1 branched-chain amino acid ABC transporter permease [Candidatus Nanopelagicales bacterium]MCF8557343.1 branched-chain amino acid ABC transporter permease [Candidatus Nanopelagicales bacterium]